jgi:hypothetical protein
MTRDYSKGKIYKIEPICEHEEEDIYIGSTTKQYLSQRICKHKVDYRRWKDGKSNKISSFNLFEKYGLDHCKIHLLEAFEAKSKDELESREAHYIKSMKCVNKHIPCRTPKQYKIDNKEKIKQYQEINKEKIDKYNKQYWNDNKEKLKENYSTEKAQKYYQDNKDKILEHRANYREENKEIIKEKSKKYRDENKDKNDEYAKQKIICECGCSISRRNISSHKKSKNHIMNAKSSETTN